MRAVGIMDIGKISMVDIPVPEINEYECLVKMHACGFCNCTDTESVMNTHIHKDMPFPHVQGHEGVGEIVKKGSKVRAYEIGDRIVFPEGRIDPKSGFFMCGCGHFADYCIVRDCEALQKDGLPLGSMFADWPRKFPKELTKSLQRALRGRNCFECLGRIAECTGRHVKRHQERAHGAAA